MSTMASQITGVGIVYSTVVQVRVQGKHQSSTSLALIREIHRSPLDSHHSGPVMRKMFPFGDVIIFTTNIVKLRRRLYESTVIPRSFFRVASFIQNSLACTVDDICMHIHMHAYTALCASCGSYRCPYVPFLCRTFVDGFIVSFLTMSDCSLSPISFDFPHSQFTNNLNFMCRIKWLAL